VLILRTVPGQMAFDRPRGEHPTVSR
jgi:hypothetical protein